MWCTAHNFSKGKVETGSCLQLPGQDSLPCLASSRKRRSIIKRKKKVDGAWVKASKITLWCPHTVMHVYMLSTCTHCTQSKNHILSVLFCRCRSWNQNKSWDPCKATMLAATSRAVPRIWDSWLFGFCRRPFLCEARLPSQLVIAALTVHAFNVHKRYKWIVFKWQTVTLLYFYVPSIYL